MSPKISAKFFSDHDHREKLVAAIMKTCTPAVAATRMTLPAPRCDSDLHSPPHDHLELGRRPRRWQLPALPACNSPAGRRRRRYGPPRDLPGTLLTCAVGAPCGRTLSCHHPIPALGDSCDSRTRLLVARDATGWRLLSRRRRSSCRQWPNTRQAAGAGGQVREDPPLPRRKRPGST